MRTVQAFNGMITADLGRAALLGINQTPKTVRMHAAQLFGLSLVFNEAVITDIQTTQDIECIERVKRLLDGYNPGTFLGCEIIPDKTVPKDQIIFQNEAGEDISRITQLAIPTLFFNDENL